MALVGPAFLDTSVLLAGLIELEGPRAPAQRIMAALAAGRLRQAATAWHCCLEFFSVATRLPEEFRLEPADAYRLLEAEIVGRLRVHELPAARRLRFLQAAAADCIAGGRIYDANIAETARLARAKVVITENRRHFLTLLAHGIAVLSAEEFAAQSRISRR